MCSVSNSVDVASSHVSNGTSAVLSAVRSRGRVTATLRPPSRTEPDSVPWRTTVRAGSCLPLGPAVVVHSPANNSLSTSRPIATDAANNPSRIRCANDTRCPAPISARRSPSVGSVMSTSPNPGTNPKRADVSPFVCDDPTVGGPFLVDEELDTPSLPAAGPRAKDHPSSSTDLRTTSSDPLP